MPIADLNIKVLIVDDYPTMRRNVRNILEDLGFRYLAEASDGGAALAMLKQETYGLCISDWNMAPITGIELLRAVRADATLAELPFIMATSDGKKESMQMAAEAGVNGYIVKPFNTEGLREKIEKVLGQLPHAA